MDRRIEVNNPLLFFILPDKSGMNYEEQYKNIYINQQTFITTFDIYHTLKYILNGEDKPITKNNIEKNGNIFDSKKHYLGTNLFDYINPYERHCSNYYDIHDCICISNNE